MVTADEYLARPLGERISMADWTASLAGHDDTHLDQLARALDGRA